MSDFRAVCLLCVPHNFCSLPLVERDNVVYWKTKRKIKNDLHSGSDSYNLSLLPAPAATCHADMLCPP